MPLKRPLDATHNLSFGSLFPVYELLRSAETVSSQIHVVFRHLTTTAASTKLEQQQ